MRNFRQVLFWIHLSGGLIAGLFIGIMCFTGAALAFEGEITAWAERDARRAATTTASVPLSLAELQDKLRAAQPAFRPTTITLLNDPAAAIVFSAGRETSLYANPCTGEIRSPASTKVRAFLRATTEWHRFLGRNGDQRPAGKLVNGICNISFCALAITGLYLWMPRTWSWKGVKAVARFNWKLAGKARDFNWHNTIGVWSAPVLIVLTLTAVPISFRWGGNLIYRVAGEEPPTQAAPAQPGPATGSLPMKITPPPDSAPLSSDAVVALVRRDFPRWSQISLPLNGSSAAPAPLVVSIRESGSWPRTATTTLTLSPFTGEVLKREGYADFTAARQIRAWTRFLHTGQALGWPGQLVAGLACLGGCFLVYTGFSLSCRRFLGRDRPKGNSPAI